MEIEPYVLQVASCDYLQSPEVDDDSNGQNDVIADQLSCCCLEAYVKLFQLEGSIRHYM
jgi:hypothetical protein